MRTLGKRLGVQAMTLRHYIPNDDALLDLPTARCGDCLATDPDRRGDYPNIAQTAPYLAADHPGAIFENGLKLVLDALD